MKQSLYLRVAVIALVATQFSCSRDGLTAPPATEKLNVAATTRAMVPGETVPALRVEAGSGTISFRVTRAGSCGMIIDAALSRQPHDLAVVAHVWADPLADCFVQTQPTVLDYSGSINVVEPGPYRVRVFDGSGNETPRLIGSAGVKVPAS
jgi:hypothetical protein